MPTPLYTAHVSVVGGRAGHARSDDGHLDLNLGTPTALGGTGAGTNPEQLFAAGFAACFLSAMGAVARANKVSVGSLRADSEVHLLKEDGGNFALQAEIVVRAAGIDQSSLDQLVEGAKKTCPYSRAVAGNVEVAISGVVDD